jgi:CHASE2 domain-containing sensor protein
VWETIYLLALTALLVFWRLPNPVWGGCVAGALIGMILSGAEFVAGHGFHWFPVFRSAAIFTVAVGVWEIIERLRGNNADWH